MIKKLPEKQKGELSFSWLFHEKAMKTTKFCFDRDCASARFLE
jgi:hypothetical protein